MKILIVDGETFLAELVKLALEADGHACFAVSGLEAASELLRSVRIDLVSLDLAVGTPIASDNNLQAGSIFALIKYNPASWFGVAVRPEYLRHMVSAPVGYPDVTEGSGRISAGVEVGERTGAVLSIGAVVVVGLVVLLFEASGGFN